MRIALTAFALFACTPPVQTTVTQAAPATNLLFRAVDVTPFGAITLGALFAGQTSAPLIEIQPRIYLLVSEGGRFADTDSLFVLLDGAGRVSGMRFVYERLKDFDAAVAEYTHALGEPSSRTSLDSAGFQLTRVGWADTRTEFELTRAASRSGIVQVSSVLLDRSKTGQ